MLNDVTTIQQTGALPPCGDPWEAGVVPVSSWIPLNNGEKGCELAAACVDPLRELPCLVDARAPGVSEAEAVRRMVAMMLELSSVRPAAVHVLDASLAPQLATTLSGLGIPVEVKADLPLIDRLASKLPQMRRPNSRALEYRPSMLSVTGVTRSTIAALASAAQRFHDSRTYQYFDSVTHILQIRVSPPMQVPPDMGHVIVDDARYGGDVGLLFYSPAQRLTWLKGDRQRVGSVWKLLYVGEFDLPPADFIVLNQLAGGTHRGPREQPFIGAMDRVNGWRRPTPECYAYLEALLLALSQVTPTDVARGIWSVTVSPTLSQPGSVTFSFVMKRYQ